MIEYSAPFIFVIVSVFFFHNGIISAHHAWNDTVNGSNIFYLTLLAESTYIDNNVEQQGCSRSSSTGTPTSSVEWKVVWTLQQLMSRSAKTRYPARLFHRILTSICCCNPASNFPPEPQIPANYYNIAHVLVTPTRNAAVRGLEWELSNAAVRLFLQDYDDSFPLYDSFIRVHITDDDGQKLFHRVMTGPRDLVGGKEPVEVLQREENNEEYETLVEPSKSSQNTILQIMKDSIKKGLLINGRHYRYLGQSSSQLKESSFWMVCLPSSGRTAPSGKAWTVDDMRSPLLGDYEECTSVPEFASRYGQNFSSTFQSSKAGRHHGVLGPSGTMLRHKEIDDIVTFHNGKKLYHSDGIGIMSRHARDQIVSHLPIPPANTSDVSIIQIRLAGAKGVLLLDTVDRCFDEDADILLRTESMVKFDAPYGRIGVCAIGKHAPYFLNRNVILLLRQHGVPKQIILQMQECMLEDLNELLRDRAKAIKRLGLLGCDATIKATLDDMLLSGMSPDRDPFILSCMQAFRVHHFNSLRKKARIFVEKGAVLIGGIDETALLPEGCVFLQVRKDRSDEDSPCSVIVGPVLVAKHPCNHDGKSVT
jgi:RNA dependent RNA polymerase